MAEKYKKQQEEDQQKPPQEEMRASVASSNMNTSQVTEDPSIPQADLCPIHGRKLEIISITTKERICS